VTLNLGGLKSVTNSAMKIIGQYCPRVEVLNVPWCNNVDTRGLRHVVEGCTLLRELNVGEMRGWDVIEVMQAIFERNNLERLVLMRCDSLTDDSLRALIVGKDPEIDFLTGRPSVPPRRLKHLDLTKCRSITDAGAKVLAHNVPNLAGLQLSLCTALTDAPLLDLLPTVPVLTHLDIDEVEHLTNATLQCLANSPCKETLQHLGLSYCENLGDAGMLPVLKSCTKLQTLDMDNTRISDLVLAEAAALVRARNQLVERRLRAGEKPSLGLRVVAYDCSNVTWMGVREILSRNAEPVRAYQTRDREGDGQERPTLTYPPTYLSLKAFYTWQPTVDQHTKRVAKGDFAAANRLERKWADWMMLSEEAGVGGGRRRRRRARLAAQEHVDEEAGVGAEGVNPRTGRRRARSGPGQGCAVM